MIKSIVARVKGFQKGKTALLAGLIITASLAMTACGGQASSVEAGKAAAGERKEESAPTEGAEAADTVRVGISASYVPWCYQKDGQNDGYEVALWKEIAKRENINIEFVTAKFSGLFGMLDAGQIDTVAHQISVTEERKEKYDFSEAYAYSSYSFSVKEDSTCQTEEDLKGKKVGVGVGGNGERTLRALNEEKNLGLDIITYDGSIGMSDVELGRIEAFWMGSIAADVMIEQSGYKMRTILSDFVHESNQYPFLKNERNTDLIKKVNAALDSMKADGSLKNLSQTYFGRDVTETD